MHIHIISMTKEDRVGIWNIFSVVRVEVDNALVSGANQSRTWE